MAEIKRNEAMVQKIGSECRRAGRLAGVSLETKNVVADPDGGDAAALRRAAGLCLLDRPWSIYLLAILESASIPAFSHSHPVSTG